MAPILDAEREKGLRLMLRALGEDPDRQGLQETPRRVVKAWRELCSGYEQDPKELIKTFDGEGYDEMVMLGPIQFYSTCEHHLLPFVGQAWVAYIPNKRTGKIIGLSKMARLVQIYARRLQVQERLTTEIAETLGKLLNARGSACLIQAQHFCMMARGVNQQGAWMTTSKLLGVFKRQSSTRAEFLALAKENK